MKPGFFAVVLFISACSQVAAQGRVGFNENSFRSAEQLITTGHFVADKKGGWSDHRPSVEEENQFIRAHGWSEYARWHLGIDWRHRENSKARYKFPLGDFQNIHRCALIAIGSRAREYRYSDIEKAASELRRMIEASEKPSHR